MIDAITDYIERSNCYDLTLIEGRLLSAKIRGGIRAN
jgi:hypothetical protein